MHSLPPNLSADQSRDPQKFSKWRKRAARLTYSLENGSLNGDTENVERILNQNNERLRQLGGIIPTVSRGQFRRQMPEKKMIITNTEETVLNKDGTYALYSTGGHRYEEGAERILTVARELEIKAEIEGIAKELMPKVCRYVAELKRGNDLIRRADDLWECTKEEPQMFASNNKRSMDPIPQAASANGPDFSENLSQNKDAAQYALDQLGYE